VGEKGGGECLSTRDVMRVGNTKRFTRVVHATFDTIVRKHVNDRIGFLVTPENVIRSYRLG
jgi:hypothetical protein